MSDKFERFTERARKVLTLAQEEAHRLGHTYIGTEHLLLGLVREGDGVAARVLTNMGVELPKVRSAVEYIIGRGESVVLGEIGLTPRAKRVIELAVDEARRLDHHVVGTEHLLLGLVREGEGIAAGVLQSLGVNLSALREHVLAAIGTAELGTAGQRPVEAPQLRKQRHLRHLMRILDEQLQADEDVATDVEIRQLAVDLHARLGAWLERHNDGEDG